MLAKDKLWIAGISGGPDSMFLLDKLRQENYKIIVAHVNYKRRVDSDFDEELVKQYCQKFSLPLEVYQVPNSEYNYVSNFQDKARRIRYNYFQKIADKYQTKYIVVAHHLDDHLETYLLQAQRKSLLEYWGLPTSIPNISFREVGGLQEAKEELGEVVSYFRNPQVFWQRGAKVPKGVLLVGPPGNGKTLLAKALAGECKLPFLFRSGSEFEEMVVGLGARRVRELFRKARSYPQGCIIFIDEIDSIGKKRHSHQSNDLTLNQLLNELDGFRPRDNIIILAATNSLNVLDSALLRPGRFDRHIYIPPPNLKGRREIIGLCASKLSLSPSLDLEEIASMTRGFSGAQITNMFNEASILSIRYNKKTIDQEIFFEAFDRVLMGPSLVSQTLTPAKRKIIAYHEAGHAVIGMSLPETTVKKITIIPRWSAGGGRASEELVFGLDYITMGAYSDFKQASTIIRDLILIYGMSDLGIIPTQESFFSGEEVPSELPETTKQKIENEREKILENC
ncbi:23655_t:CDS:2 [Entrophospora sp. SA101]|nr:15090_t:CDS:2 [Entrophospora sp. SA101]CAJ0749005.1 23655_t:CDS:2 [Entrophospora sp. SA101]CAJ0824590.1 22178_t:CDS:2 [Entrophospora sp. SA101]CAJ0845131.1 8021_t:CDS:2 [Entrophospora sp. SA101]